MTRKTQKRLKAARRAAIDLALELQSLGDVVGEKANQPLIAKAGEAMQQVDGQLATVLRNALWRRRHRRRQ